MKGSLQNVIDFECAACKREYVVQPRCEKVEIGDVSLECVDEFCYLGDKLSAGGGAEANSVAGVRSGWKKFRELLPLLTLKGLSLHIKGKLYASCVFEKSMLKWMSSVKLSDRI